MLPVRRTYYSVMSVECLLFFNDPATTEIYTLSLHDALPICGRCAGYAAPADRRQYPDCDRARAGSRSEEHTSELQSRVEIWYAVFCLKQTNRGQMEDAFYALDPLVLVCPLLCAL